MCGKYSDGVGRGRSAASASLLAAKAELLGTLDAMLSEEWEAAEGDLRHMALGMRPYEVCGRAVGALRRGGRPVSACRGGRDGTVRCHHAGDLKKATVVACGITNAMFGQVA